MQNIYRATNQFTGGLDLDTDPLFKKPTVLSDACDIRLIDHDGQNFTVTNVNGNTYQFNLPTNFTPLGYAVYNGIAYILSYNAVNGYGQIGSFPSPKPLNIGGFDRVYKPLQNWTGTSNPAIGTPVGGDFTTDLFNFDLEHQIQAFARVDYDDSVNIYFVDNKNVFRVINSGFNQLGFNNDRYYWNESFNSIINVFNSSNSPVIVSSMVEDTTGNLKCGNWFYFFRYTTADFNATSFLSEAGPIQISKSASTAIQTEGNVGSELSDKAVNLTLTNIDVSYPFIEVGYIHYFDGSYETGLINQLYAINPASTTLDIKITGTESIVALTAAELISNKIVNDIPKTAVQLENSAWLGNLKGKDLFHPDLLQFANNITIGFDDSRQLHDTTFSYDPTTNNGQYKYYLNTFESVGYFRGETYAFGIVFVFNDGKESQALPLTGYDDFFNTQLNSNTDGIYRFPTHYYSPFKTGDFLNILAVKFDATNAFASATTWFNDNIKGYYFVRGKRNANLIYQGVALQCYLSSNLVDPKQAYAYRDGTIAPNQSCPTIASPNTNINYGSQGSIPLLGSTVPYRMDCHNSGHSFGDNVQNYVTLDAGIVYGQNLHETVFGLYSPDFFFINAFKDGNYKFLRVAQCTIDHGSPNYGSYGLHLAPYALDELQSMTGFAGILSFEAPFVNVPEWSTSPLRGNQFVSMFDEGTQTSTTCFADSYTTPTGGGDDFWHYYNRAFATTRYIGINGSADIQDRQVIGIYTNDPVNGYVYTNQYDIKTVEYFKISQFKFTDAGSRELISTCYNGDCFLQRTYIKQLGNPETYSPSAKDNASYTTFDTFGIGMSIVTENNYNTAMRGSDQNNTYYPKLGLTAPEEFFAFNIKRESNLLNVGYNVTLSPKVFQGFDKNIPFTKTHYPTRIAYSNRHDPNSLKDGYRSFDIAAYKDFDYRLGEITCLVDFGSILLNVQQFGISNHPITEKTMLTDGAAGSLTLGTGERLPVKPISVSDLYGSQHQWSIIKTPMGVLGVDVNKRKIWRITAEGLEVISDTKRINKYIIDTINSYGSSYSDIVDIVKDNPVNGTGIVSAYDQRYGDIIFTFINESGESYTICFNDKMQTFVTKFNFKSPFYITLNDNFYSANPSDKSSLFLHDVATVSGLDNKATWYNNTYNPYIEFVVNQYSDMTKIFDNLQLVSDPVPFKSIEYNTEQQIASQNPFIPSVASDMYAEPKYRENLWRLAIKRATGVIGILNNPYSIGSILRGKTLKVKLTFKDKTPNAIKSVLSYFKISKS